MTLDQVREIIPEYDLVSVKCLRHLRIYQSTVTVTLFSCFVNFDATLFRIGLYTLDIHCFHLKIHLVRKVLESKIAIRQNLTKGIRKPPKSVDLGGFLWSLQQVDTILQLNTMQHLAVQCSIS